MVVKLDCITFAGRINKSITLVLHSTNNNMNDFALHSANMRGQPWLYLEECVTLTDLNTAIGGRH